MSMKPRGSRRNVSPHHRAADDAVLEASPDGQEKPRQSTEHTPREASQTLLPTADSEIQRPYLTFATRLPSANTSPIRPDQLPSPPQPDLAAYANPILWPRHRKNVMLALSCVATFLTAYTAGAYSPPSRTIAAALDGGSAPHLAVVAGITTFCAGFALAPMVLAPLSELNGRYPVFVVAGVVFVAFQAACGAVDTLAGMLAARFLVGVGSSVFSTMVGGVIADLWDAEGRNTPMALFSGAVLLGTGVGPLVGALSVFTTEGRGLWRWVFYHQAIADALFMVVFVLVFKESRGPVLLSRKARALNRWYEELEEKGYFGVWVDDEELLLRGGTGDVSGSDTTSIEYESGITTEPSDEEKTPASSPRTTTLRRIRWRVKADEERSSIGRMISVSVSRPFHLLFTEPVVFFFSLWVAFAWAVLYLTFGCIPLVYATVYGWSVDASGRVFLAIVAGTLVATVISIAQERLLHHPSWAPDSDNDSRFWQTLRRRLPSNVPESRLYFTCITATCLPIGLFAFGLSARADAHWLGPAVSIAVATVGIFAVYLAAFNYLADVYQTYASSAIAAQSCCRNLLGGAFPLVTSALFRGLGPVNAGVLLGCVAAALTLVPWVLVMFGEKIRARSRFAMALDKA